jgi:hypothetical protein
MRERKRNKFEEMKTKIVYNQFAVVSVSWVTKNDFYGDFLA